MKSRGAIISVIILCIFSFASFWTCCDDVLELFVFTGHRSLTECQSLAKKYEYLASKDKITFICPGEEVTIYWESTASTVNVDPGFGSMSSPGVAYLTVNSNTTITATAKQDCKKTKSFDIKVVGSNTRSTHIGVVTVDCKKIRFEVEEAFYSSKIEAVSIEPKFGPSNICPTCVVGPKFLDMHHNGYDKEISTGIYNFERKVTAVGKWDFDVQCCGQGCDCNPYTSKLMFWLNLYCP